jgi:hypothetical protein
MREVSDQRTGAHLCIKKFAWSWRPRVYIHYWDAHRNSMVYVGIFKSKNNNWEGINGCQK